MLYSTALCLAPAGLTLCSSDGTAGPSSPCNLPTSLQLLDLDGSHISVHVPCLVTPDGAVYLYDTLFACTRQPLLVHDPVDTRGLVRRAPRTGETRMVIEDAPSSCGSQRIVACRAMRHGMRQCRRVEGDSTALRGAAQCRPRGSFRTWSCPSRSWAA